MGHYGFRPSNGATGGMTGDIETGNLQRKIDLQGKIVTVLGGTGFFGKHLAQELLARGARLRIASRNPERAYRLKPLGNLGQTALTRCDVTRPETLASALAGSDAVINLVGAFNGDLDAVQGEGAGRIAKAARKAGAKAFVHVSAIGADAESPIDYARTKAEGENAVRAAFPNATILRPSLLFGPDDNFVMMFAGLIQSMPALPVFGPDAGLQPVFIDDAAEAAATAISTVARTTTIASAARAVNASVTCSSMAIACSGRSTRSNPNPKPQPRPKANPDRALTLRPTPTLPLTLALRLPEAAHSPRP